MEMSAKTLSPTPPYSLWARLKPAGRKLATPGGYFIIFCPEWPGQNEPVEIKWAVYWAVRLDSQQKNLILISPYTIKKIKKVYE